MNLVFDGSKLKPHQWAELYAERHPKVPSSPTWIYEWNLCTKCESPLVCCVHNPYRVGSQPRTVHSVIEDTPLYEESPSRLIVQHRQRKPKGSVLKELPEDQAQAAMKRYKKGEGLVALANEFNVQPPWLSQYLKDNGCIVKKGKR